MIRVNLLPQEYRKGEATDLKQFFSTIGAVILAALAIVGWGLVHFYKLNPTIDKRNQLEEEIKAQAKDLKTSKDLAAQLAEFKGRYKKIDEVASSRLVLSRKIDEFWEVVVKPASANRYEVWLKGLTVSLLDSGRNPRIGGTTQFGGTSAGAEVTRLVDFHEDLKKSEFYGDFQDITHPYGTLENLGDKREPTEGWSFTFQLTLKPLKDLYKDRAAAAAAEEQAGAEKKGQ